MLLADGEDSAYAASSGRGLPSMLLAVGEDSVYAASSERGLRLCY